MTFHFILILFILECLKFKKIENYVCILKVCILKDWPSMAEVVE